MTEYLLKSVVISFVFAAYYAFALKDKRMFAFNRFYIGLSVIVSLLLPLVEFRSIGPVQPDLLFNVVYIRTVEPGMRQVDALIFESYWILPLCYCLICLAGLLQVGAGFRRIYHLKKAGVVHQNEEYCLVETTARQAPFSFFRIIFWRKDLPGDQIEKGKMFLHELAHVQLIHSLDRTLLRLILVFCWFNPVFWYLYRELIVVQEYQADEIAFPDNDVVGFAEAILGAVYPVSVYFPANYFFNFTIKRRLTMIKNSDAPLFVRFRKWLVVPVTLPVIAIVVFACKKNQVADNRQNELKNEIRDDILADLKQSVQHQHQTWDSAFVDVGVPPDTEKKWIKFMRECPYTETYDSVYTDITGFDGNGNPVKQKIWVSVPTKKYIHVLNE